MGERLSPWRSKPPQTVVDLLQGLPVMYLVHRTGPTSFVVREDGAEVKRKISIGARMCCSCTSASAGQPCSELCAHLLFVMSKVLRVPPSNPLCWQLSLTDRELDEVLRCASLPEPPPQSSDTGSNTRKQSQQQPGEEGSVPRRPLDSEDPCPICYEDMTNAQPGHLVWCRIGCGRNVHGRCMGVWAEHQTRTLGKELSCPLCRAEWGEFKWRPPPAPRRKRREDTHEQAANAAHMGTCCGACRKAPLVGKRYKCLICADYDLCEGCFDSGQHPHHPFACKATPTAFAVPAQREEMMPAAARIAPPAPPQGPRASLAAIDTRAAADASPVPGDGSSGQHIDRQPGSDASGHVSDGPNVRDQTRPTATQHHQQQQQQPGPGSGLQQDSDARKKPPKVSNAWKKPTENTPRPVFRPDIGDLQITIMSFAQSGSGLGEGDLGAQGGVCAPFKHGAAQRAVGRGHAQGTLRLLAPGAAAAAAAMSRAAGQPEVSLPACGVKTRPSCPDPREQRAQGGQKPALPHAPRSLLRSLSATEKCISSNAVPATGRVVLAPLCRPIGGATGTEDSAVRQLAACDAPVSKAARALPPALQGAIQRHHAFAASMAVHQQARQQQPSPEAAVLDPQLVSGVHGLTLAPLGIGGNVMQPVDAHESAGQPRHTSHLVTGLTLAHTKRGVPAQQQPAAVFAIGGRSLAPKLDLSEVMLGGGGERTARSHREYEPVRPAPLPQPDFPASDIRPPLVGQLAVTVGHPLGSSMSALAIPGDFAADGVPTGRGSMAWSAATDQDLISPCRLISRLSDYGTSSNLDD